MGAWTAACGYFPCVLPFRREQRQRSIKSIKHWNGKHRAIVPMRNSSKDEQWSTLTMSRLFLNSCQCCIKKTMALKMPISCHNYTRFMPHKSRTTIVPLCFHFNGRNVIDYRSDKITEFSSRVLSNRGRFRLMAS